MVEIYKNASIWKQEDNSSAAQNSFRSAGLEELDLTVRSANALKRAGCMTVGDILAVIENSEKGLKNVRNLGDKCQREILEKLDSLEKIYMSKTVSLPNNSTNLRILMMPEGKTWNRTIDSVRITEKTKDVFKKCGIIKVGQLYDTTNSEDPGWHAVRELFDNLIIGA